MAEVSSEEKARENREMDEKDYDGKIMAQERLLEKEVQESAPLVGACSQVSSLGLEYASDPVYLQKIAVSKRVANSFLYSSSFPSSSSSSSLLLIYLQFQPVFLSVITLTLHLIWPVFYKLIHFF